MRTLIVSDLHLGSVSGTDLMREPAVRAQLFDVLKNADRLILLGDLIELRDAHPQEAMEMARPFFEELGRAFAGRDVVLVAGNHDHALVSSWLGSRPQTSATQPLCLDQCVPPEASPMLSALATWTQPARLVAQYPGVWVRDDVYATHGHYLDSHVRGTSGERIMISLARAALRCRCMRSVADYESVTAPIYARLNTSAQMRWLAYDRNLARVGRLLSGLWGDRLLSAEVQAMEQVAENLGLDCAHLVFGHIHRGGSFARKNRSRDDRHSEGRLLNTGSWHGGWIASPSADGRNRCFAGSYAVVEDHGPPVVAWLQGRL